MEEDISKEVVIVTRTIAVMSAKCPGKDSYEADKRRVNNVN
jgi:hypothetical protein